MTCLNAEKSDAEHYKCLYSEQCLEHIRVSKEFYDSLNKTVLLRIPQALDALDEIKNNSKQLEALNPLSEALVNLTSHLAEGGRNAKSLKLFNLFKLDSKTLVIIVLAVLVLLKEFSPILSEFELNSTGAHIVTSRKFYGASTTTSNEPAGVPTVGGKDADTRREFK